MSLEAYPHQRALIATAKRHFQPKGRDLIQVATGGGKTFIMMDFARWCAKKGKRVLVVTKDWFLLEQAAEDLIWRHRDGIHLCGYVGGRGFVEGVPQTRRKGVLFTTIQTWNRRLNWPKFDVILVDEIHWGEGAPLYTKLLRANQDAYVLGFTATPRSWTEFRRIGRAYTFDTLVRLGFLSRPIVVPPVQTGVAWNPQRSGRYGDLTQTSLSELAARDERNRKIVLHYVDNKDKYGKTIVFACNIAHAQLLHRMFQAAGVEAVHLHHKLSSTERSSAIQGFSEGTAQVMINVSMLTHGVDIPDIKTVFLTRPTLSDILFSQMIGRGARKTDTKDTFYVVDFVDLVTTYNIPILRPDGFLGTARSEREPGKHRFIPAPFEFFPRVEGYEDIEGLDVHPQQTFGIEFEVAVRGEEQPATNELRRKARAILEGIQQIAPATSSLSFRHGLDYSQWNVVRDSSCGLEVVSRVLEGVDGFREVMDVTRKLREVAVHEDLWVNKNTGTHVHLGWGGEDDDEVRRLLRIVAYYEPALFSLVSKSRIRNEYAAPLREVHPRQIRALETDRYHTIDIESRNRLGTIEVRLHNGSLNGPKILTWISLWMRILERARKQGSPPVLRELGSNEQPFTAEDDSDVASLANFVDTSGRLKKRLLLRREDLVSRNWPDLPDEIRQRWTQGLCASLMAEAQGATEAETQEAHHE